MERKIAKPFVDQAALAELYCISTEATSIASLMTNTASILNHELETQLMTFLDVDSRALYLAGEPLEHEQQSRIEAHALRCLEGVDKSTAESEHLSLTKLFKSSASSPNAAFDLLWTGAIERAGRLVGVLTFYGQRQNQHRELEKTMRAARRIIGDAVTRLHRQTETRDGGRNKDKNRSMERAYRGPDAVVLTLDSDVTACDITGIIMPKLQDAVAKRIVGVIPDAFLVAKLGVDKLMLVADPAQSPTIEQWREVCERALVQIARQWGFPVDFELEAADMSSLTQCAFSGLLVTPPSESDSAKLSVS